MNIFTRIWEKLKVNKSVKHIQSEEYAEKRAATLKIYPTRQDPYWKPAPDLCAKNSNSLCNHEWVNRCQPPNAPWLECRRCGVDYSGRADELTSKATASASLVGELETFLTEHEITGWREDMFAGLRKIMFSYDQTFDVATSKADSGDILDDANAAAKVLHSKAFQDFLQGATVQTNEQADIGVIANSLESISWSLNTNALDSQYEKLRAMSAVLPQVGEAKTDDFRIAAGICRSARKTGAKTWNAACMECAAIIEDHAKRAAPAGFGEAKAVEPIYFIGDSGDVWKETTKSNYDIWIGRKRIMYTAPVAQTLSVATQKSYTTGELNGIRR